MSLVNSYGKVDEAEHAKLMARRRRRKRIAIIAVSSILLMAIVVGAVVGAVVGTRGSSDDNSDGGGDKSKSMSTSIKAACDVTLYKDSCYSSLAHKANPDHLKPEDVLKLSILVALEELSNASQLYFSKNGEAYRGIKDNMTLAALQDCQDLLGLAIDNLNNSLSVPGSSLLTAFEDLRSWLSAAGTCHQTCIDGLQEANSNITAQDYLKKSAELTSNCLAIATWFQGLVSKINFRRRLISEGESSDDGMPHWMRPGDRKLLRSTDVRKNADFVVAKDGSGKFKTIGAALEAVPDKSKKRVVIYVKKGVYTENVRVEKSKWNVMVVGDGMNFTIVSGSKNVIDGTPTFQSATFAVFAKCFIARDIGFRNTAGPIKHQAVALMSTGDQSVFYRCNIDAFQDSLYAHSNRQFYRECNLLGTVDFIFGNSAVVIQNCNILPRKPMAGHQNTITAQGKIDPNQNTGIVIQNCSIWPSENLTGVQTFLGRPWKDYSRTVIMQSTMGDFISPSGWLPWTGTTAPPTIFYAEYQNSGPGASIKNRVKWTGLKLYLTAKQLAKFTVKPFIQGDKWIPGSGAGFKPGL